MRVRVVVGSLQNGLAHLLGIVPEGRTIVVRTMLHRPNGDAAGYWLQLLIAAVLATLGLALNSTAVVIGAMLIAPLMRPIVELSMGLATGSTPLVFRTGLRSILSIAVVVFASMAITSFLPFHEPTEELLARTAPSLLDLFVAAACAVAGAYAVIVSSNDVATTAAGTSIGISLVPPLCTTGYGIATANWVMAKNAALLFTANVTGILTVAGLVFVIVGFGQVDVRAEERELDDDDDVGAATRFGRRVSSRLTPRLGVLPRVLFPIALLAAVSAPLQSAVGEMTRRSTLRKRVSELLSQSSSTRVVHYELDQHARTTALRIVVVGDVAAGQRLEKQVRNELRALGERNPRVVVWAVPDADAFSALATRLDGIPLEVAPPPPPPPPPPTLHERLVGLWPQSAGRIVRTWQSPESPGTLRIVHLGEPLGDAGREVLARALSTEEGDAFVIDAYALTPAAAPVGEEGQWLARALPMIDRVRDIPELHLCIEAPPVPKRRPPQELVTTRRALDEAVKNRENVTIADGTSWRLEAREAACDATEPPP